MFSEEQKQLIEKNPLALATINKDNTPNVIGVAYVKVKDSKLLITNNYMKNTLENIEENNNVCLAVWNSEWKGLKLSGVATYKTEGDEFNFVKSLEENKEELCLGVIIVDVKNISEL